MRNLVNKIVSSIFNREIQIIHNAKENETTKMPLTVDEVKWYIQEVRKINPNYLKGIKKIYLCNRPKDFHSNVMGAFSPDTPEGKVIFLYTVSYFPKRKMYTLDYSSFGKIKFGYDETQIKKMMLYTLGHEIGHNVFYDKTGRLFGVDVEEFCNLFAEKLNIVQDEEKNGKMFHVDDPVDVFMESKSNRK